MGERWLGDLVQGGHSIPGLTGDGMRMLWQAGAQKAPVAMTFSIAINGVTDKHHTIESVMNQLDLIVDKNGLRVMNEACAQDPEYLGQQLIRAKEHKLYTIIDSRILEEYKNHGLSWYNPIHTVSNLNSWEQELSGYEQEQDIFMDDDPEFAEFFEEIKMNPGDFWICRSVEEIAEKTGIALENLKKTIAEYNAGAGCYDPLFDKPAQYLKPIQTAPFYVAAHTISALESRGGIFTDENMRCFNENQAPIKGLYCIGTDANNIMGQAVSFHRIYGASLSFAFASAKIAVEDAIRYLNEEFEPID